MRFNAAARVSMFCASRAHAVSLARTKVTSGGSKLDPNAAPAITNTKRFGDNAAFDCFK